MEQERRFESPKFYFICNTCGHRSSPVGVLSIYNYVDHHRDLYPDHEVKIHTTGIAQNHQTVESVNPTELEEQAV